MLGSDQVIDTPALDRVGGDGVFERLERHHPLPVAHGLRNARGEGDVQAVTLSP